MEKSSAPKKKDKNMSTRATVHFEYATGEDEAIIYCQWDGYPEDLGEDLQSFFAAVQAQTIDTRFYDASYLAAKFVVWKAGQYAKNKAKPLDFLSLGIVKEDPDDIEYRYLVKCNGNEVPEVKSQVVDKGEGG